MKKYFCDVCGAEIAGEPSLSAAYSWAADVCSLEDLCPRCDGLARNLAVDAVVLAALRRLAAEADAPKEAAPPPALPSSFVPVLAGRGAKEKQAILSAINAFRKEHGPGSVIELADMAGVIDSDIWSMLAGKKVLMCTWRKVGKALNVSNLDTGKET